jgi:hypothetical protein
MCVTHRKTFMTAGNTANPTIVVALIAHHTPNNGHVMVLRRLTWDFLQNSTCCSKSSPIHWVETNLHHQTQSVWGLTSPPYAPRRGQFIELILVSRSLPYTLWTIVYLKRWRTQLSLACLLTVYCTMEPVAGNSATYLYIVVRIYTTLCTSSSCILCPSHEMMRKGSRRRVTDSAISNRKCKRHMGEWLPFPLAARSNA